MIEIINKSNLVSKKEVNKIINFVLEENNEFKTLDTKIYLYQTKEQVMLDWNRRNIELDHKLLKYSSMIYYKNNLLNSDNFDRIEIYLFNLLHCKIKDSYNLTDEIAGFMFHELRHSYQRKYLIHYLYDSNYKILDNKDEHYKQKAEVDAIEFQDKMLKKYFNSIGKLSYQLYDKNEWKKHYIKNNNVRIKMGEGVNDLGKKQYLYGIFNKTDYANLKKQNISRLNFLGNILMSMQNMNNDILYKFNYKIC